MTESIPKKKAITLCNQSIRRMLDHYQRNKNPHWRALIQKRIRLRRWIKQSGRPAFTRKELGLSEPGWLLQQIGAISALIQKTNRYC